MNRYLLAIISFALGICCTLAFERLFTGGHKGTVHADSRYTPLIAPLGISIPRIPPVSADLHEGNQYETGWVQLDGMVSFREQFTNPLGTNFMYGGGAFQMRETFISGPLSLTLTGAAANTFMLLDSFGLIVHASATNPNPSAFPKQGEINKPRETKIKLTRPLKGDISSQYDGMQR